MPGHATRRYLYGLAAGVVLLSSCLALLVVRVDPYRAFGTAGILHATSLKPRAEQRESLAKSRIVLRSHARTLLLGNSRVEIGLDPASTQWPADMRPVVNAAEAGMGLDTALCRLNDALASGHPTLIVLGVDIQDFLVKPTAAPSAQPACDGHDLLASTFSIDAVVDSLLTIAGQNPTTGVTMTPDGFNPLREYTTYVHQIGYEGLFAAKMADYRRIYALKPAPGFRSPEDYAPFRQLSAILKRAGQQHIPLVIYMHPYHDEYLAMLRSLNLWPSFQSWKLAVRSMANAEHPPATVLDFSTAETWTNEAVSPKNGPEMRFYWEPGHYKAALGDLIIAKIVEVAGAK